jgi:ribonuclease III
MASYMEKSFPDKKRQKGLKELEKRLSYDFHNISLLETALTHRSYVNENPRLAVSDNERYEFLGDAVLGLCVSDLLVKKYDDFDEGTLSKIRAALVNEKPLALLAQKLDIGNFLMLGKGEESSGGRTKDSLLANTLEAIIAAIYLDSGFTKARSIVKKLIASMVQNGNLRFQYFDYKTTLQELCQKKYKCAPVYKLIDSSGPDHAKIFAVEVNIADEIIGIGSGKSKKEAEKQAAQKVWEELRDENK